MTWPLGAMCILGKKGKTLAGKLKFWFGIHWPSFQTCWVGLWAPSEPVPNETRTPPSASVTTVGYHRPPVIWPATRSQWFIVGS